MLERLNLIDNCLTISEFCTKNRKKHLTISLIEFIIYLCMNTVYGGDNMAMHTIDRVREAEQAAAKKREEAELQAQTIVEDAHKEADTILLSAREAAAEQEKNATDEARCKADEVVRKAREQALISAAALKEKIMSLRQNIINKLIEETLV